MTNLNDFTVAVIGAGPAGLYAAKTLADDGAQVILVNRDIKTGGLAEYGIFQNKEKMKGGLRKQFRGILEHENIAYYGNVTIGNKNDLSLDDFRDAGVDAILVTVGAQGTKWLGLPGEDLKGVYHAKDLVYHYNKLPPFSEQAFNIGKRVALIGAGNVMIDIANWTIRDLKVDEVVAIVRRGPAEVKFTKKEFEIIAANMDMDLFEKEFKRTEPIMENVEQDAEKAKSFILSCLKKAYEPVSDTTFRFDFLASPKRMLGDDEGNLIGLEVDETTLVLKDGVTKPQRLGTTHILDVDTVVFCIGDKVDEDFGLPLTWNEFAKSPNPRFPMDDHSYEAYNPETEEPLPDIFLAGWAREASSGLVGAARKDGTNGAKAVMAYLQTQAPKGIFSLADLEKRLAQTGQPFVSKSQWEKLDHYELAEAERQGLPSFKSGSNKEMLEVIGLEMKTTR